MDLRSRVSRWLVPGDIDGFFALFIDNLLLLMLVATIVPTLCGLPASFVFERILPAAAFSIFVGNLFYGWQARRLAARTKRDDVTALPYGINTISVISFCYYIMGPVYSQTGDPMMAWKVGLFACFLTGLIEFAGAFCVDWLRRNTPRAALLCPLAGIALTFLMGSFVYKVYSSALIGVLPMLLTMIAYAAKIRLPGRIPAGVFALVVGIAMTELSRFFGWPTPDMPPVGGSLGVHLPTPVNMLEIIGSVDGLRYFSVILPIAILGVLSSVQILDSAEANGDRYDTRSSLIVNGLGTLTAAMFGSTFTTALYIGHPAWKAMGARSGYSILNGLAIMILCLSGAMTLVVQYVPLTAMLGLMIWVGIMMMTQSVEAIPTRHFAAVFLGLMPALAGWTLTFVQSAVAAAGGTLGSAREGLDTSIDFTGMAALGQGSLITSMLFGAVMVFIIEREFLKAMAWALAAAFLSFFGIIHGVNITDYNVEGLIGWGAASGFSIAYTLIAAALGLCHLAQRAGRLPSTDTVESS